ncbi:hybrid sensor histidine kinase/response regulator [Pseudanabaena sp. FACHB-2040]|uniref:hybrid sensor histidine kinase/response regulator n=1 Tax=Pseudanabaena sp. FACHB-2040 TaxID=2692859 RepID=UPI0016862683|nr:hybrid sensor histidine kinase/response regulator [Pseudanabaena sp. FACHB-2040]MBD2257756.1 hybrid sensor histidine kinase/response regulator [Pseudanabaena sp. FACHB-2040]
MASNSDIRDQAYRFFVEEAPELLQTIETGLLTLRQERNTAEVHQIMRAAHSLKGGAASVGLDAIKAIAHRLETLFKALYSDSLVLDSELESQLLRAFDCLRLPLTEQLTQGYFDAQQALATADPVLAELETRFQQAITETENYIPSSTDLGINMALSIFDIDVGQGLDHLKAILDSPASYEVAGELRAQAEVFIGFAELLSLPGFAHIAQTALQALEHNPDQALEIAALAWEDFRAGREEVLAGKVSEGGSPSAALMALADPIRTGLEAVDVIDLVALLGSTDASVGDLFLPEDVEVAAQEVTAQNAPVDPFVDTSSDEALAAASVTQLFPSFELEALALESDSKTDAESTTELLFPEFEAAEIEEIFSGLAAELLEPPEDWPQPGEPDPQITPLSSDKAAPLAVQVNTRGNTKEATEGALEQGLKPAAQVAPVPIRSEPQPQRRAAVSLTVRVDTERLARMDNTLGELTINRNGLALQNDQLRLGLRELMSRFDRLRSTVEQLQTLSDQMLIAPERRSTPAANGHASKPPMMAVDTLRQASFDSLEMDSYTILYTQTQTLLEEMLQLEEGIEDLFLFNRQSDQMLRQHRKMLSQIQDELMWARMVPVGEVLNQFPRILRDLSNTYHKPAELVLQGTDLLVDRAVLEKLYDPLLHLLRNGFDHGLEAPDLRRQQGKPETGRIDIQASYQGRRIVIEVRDDGQGLDLERIRQQVVELGWLEAAAAAATPPNQLSEFIFQPGFSTASEVSDLSGRGVGLDVVREQLELLQGTVALQSTPGQGTTFTLTLPLTLSIVNLLVCFVGSTPVALRSDNITEILIPRPEQLSWEGQQQKLRWQEQDIPAYRLSDLLSYACPIPERPVSQVLAAVPSPADWEAPMLILKRGDQAFALQVERLVTEQESVIKPFGSALTPPSYAYGCTVLGDGSLIPVIDGRAFLDTLVNRELAERPAATVTEALETIVLQTAAPQEQPVIRINQANTVLVVDDAVTSRRILTLSLERAGYRVLQARDGQEALEQLEQNPWVRLVVCDIEMPNMNGFEFLTQRRQNPVLTEIPTVMLTSRSNDKHRWLAMQLGATAYFTKPYLEQEFLGAIATHIEAAAPAATF